MSSANKFGLKYCFTETKELLMKMIFNTLKLKIIKLYSHWFHTKLIIVANQRNLNDLLGMQRYCNLSTVKKRHDCLLLRPWETIFFIKKLTCSSQHCHTQDFFFLYKVSDCKIRRVQSLRIQAHAKLSLFFPKYSCLRHNKIFWKF